MARSKTKKELEETVKELQKQIRLLIFQPDCQESIILRYKIKLDKRLEESYWNRMLYSRIRR